MESAKPDSMLEAVVEAFSSLKVRQQRILIAHCVEKKSMRKIGVELNISKERVRQIESAALRVFRHSPISRHYQAFTADQSILNVGRKEFDAWIKGLIPECLSSD